MTKKQAVFIDHDGGIDDLLSPTHHEKCGTNWSQSPPCQLLPRTRAVKKAPHISY